MNESLYNLLSNDAKLKIQHASDNTDVGKTCGWFVRGSLNNHFEYLANWIESDSYPKFTEHQWKYILELSDSEEWEDCYAKLIACYYCSSANFDAADLRFNQHLLPNIKHFKNRETAEFLLSKIEDNNQLYRRNRASHDHKKIREAFNRFLPTDYDYSEYRHFDEDTREEPEEAGS